MSEKEIADRNLVYAFKDGRAYEEVTQMTASSMKKQYGETCTDIVFSQSRHLRTRKMKSDTRLFAKEYVN